MSMRRFLYWIASLSVLCFCVFMSQGCLEEERTALLKIRDSWNYPIGSYLVEEWVGYNCCEWRGVTCDFNSSTSPVVEIDLSEVRFSFSGRGYFYVPGEEWYPNATLFTPFKELRWLDLSLNNIGGWIMPEALCGLANLRTLSLGGNNLDDEGIPRCPPHHLSLLEEVDLSENGRNISSPLLTALCGLTNLRVLGLTYNNLSMDSLPSCLLHAHSSLETLYLRGCNLESSPGVMSALCGARNLKMLDLSENNLGDGSLQICPLYNLSSLETLYLSDNDIKGLAGSLTALCGLRNLRMLDLHYNDLSNGTLPACLLHEHSSLETLDLCDCNLVEGSRGVLTALSGARNLKNLNLSDNNLNDESMRLCSLYNLSSLESLNLAYNDIEGSSNFLTALCGLRNLRMLDLHYNDLSNGTLPACLLHEHSSLETLDLRDCNLVEGSRGVLTALSGARNLKNLYLSDNNLNDESMRLCSLHNLSSLESLNLAHNDIEGSSNFLTGLCNLKTLRYLDLAGNMVEGSISTCWGNMKSLETLDLSHNRITGTISSFIFGNLTSLISVDLGSNQLDGILSFSLLANLSKLKEIDLSDNVQLHVETESPTWIPTFQLEYLSLDNCNLNKHSHGNIPSFISTQYSLEDVSLAYNSLQGTIPPWLFYNVTLMSLTLTGNMLVGQFPMPFGNKTSTLGMLDISENRLRGKLPTNIDELFPQLMYFNMSTNKLEGSIPPSFGNLLNLYALDLSSNNLYAFPKLSNTTSITNLRLDSNFFIGPVSINASSFPSLEILDISRSCMSKNLSNWLPVLPQLNSLLLGSNNFVGCIPESLCQMQQLHILDLSGNNLSGSIPSCLNNITSWKNESPSFYSSTNIYLRGRQRKETMLKVRFTTKKNSYIYEGDPLTYMTGIDFSINQLQGDIPTQMGELIVLRSLNLSHNLLTGHFPESFQKLKCLESLDLSNNKLMGTIPPQIIQLNFLSVFNVSFNNLSGKIPFEENFNTFTESSYIGNLGLCGLPLIVNCSLFHNTSSQFPHNGHRKERSIVDNDLFFYSCVAICYALGFWAFVAPLLLSRNWRRYYFGIMDECFDWCSERLMGLLFCIKNCC